MKAKTKVNDKKTAIFETDEQDNEAFVRFMERNFGAPTNTDGIPEEEPSEEYVIELRVRKEK